MRRFVAGVGAMTMLLLAACSSDDGDRVTGGSDTIVVETSAGSTATVPTTESSTSEPAATEPSTTLAADEPRTVAGLDGTLWNVTIQGLVFGDPLSGGRRPKGCAVVFGSLELVTAPDAITYPAISLPVTLAAGGRPHEADPVGVCQLSDESRSRDYYNFLLVGSSVPISLTFRGDEFDGSVPPVLSLGAEQPAELSPPVLDAAPAPTAATSGPLDDVAQPADLETEYTSQVGQVKVRQVGVFTMPVDDGWCVMVFTSMTVVEGGFEAYFQYPNVSVLVDGRMENALFGGPAVSGGCADIADGWRRDPNNQDIQNGAVFGAAVAFRDYPTEPGVQAVALPSGTEGSTFEWVFVEPIVLDSPPPPPGG